MNTSVPEEDYQLNVDFKYTMTLSGSHFSKIKAGYDNGGDFLEDFVCFSFDYFDEIFSVG